MLKLYLIRHGHAGDPDRWEGPDDSRPLSERGRRDLRRTAAVLARRETIDILCTSPLVRAVQTAEIVAAAVGYGGRLVVSEALEPEARVSRTVAWLAALEGEDSVALCAHEPILSSLAGALLQVDRFAALRKGEAVRLRLPEGPGHPGELRWRIDPETGARETP